MFVDRAVPPGLPAVETIEAIREQGGLVGIPHRSIGPGVLLRDATMASLAPLVDWSRLTTRDWWVAAMSWRSTSPLSRPAGRRRVRCAHRARGGVAYTALEGDLSTAEGFKAALAAARVVPGAPSYVARLVTPVAKVVQRVRGKGRVAVSPGSRRAASDRPTERP